MTAVSNYIDLQDSSSTLQFNGPVSHNFNFFDVPSADLGVRPILAFRVAPSVGASFVTLQMTLNGVQIVTATFHSDQGRAWIEIVETNALQAVNNQLVATVTAGNGAITVSDVVFWYRVNV